MPRYAHVNPTHDLLAQFKRQRKSRQLTNQMIADATDLSIDTVNVAMSGRRMTHETALLIGDALGFSPEHVLSCWARDEAQRLKRVALSKEQENKAAAFGRIYDGLKRWSDRQRQLFRSKGSGHRLALRRLRVCGLESRPRDKHISRRTLASNVVKDRRQHLLGPKVKTVDHVHQVIKRYEGDILDLDTVGLSVILDAIGAELGEKLDISTLDTISKRLKGAHSVAQTTPWKRYSCSPSSWSPAFVVLDEEHAEISSGRTKTRLGPIEVEYITMRQLMPEARGTTRIVNAKHSGLEIAVVLEGRARLTLSHGQLPAERLEDRSHFEVGRDTVVHDGMYQSGDVLIFDSSMYHRVECLADQCRFVSILISGNVALGRTLG